MDQKPRSGHVPRGYENLEAPIRERLATYEDLVRQWAERLDLVSPGDLERFGERHVADSLKALGLLSGLPPGEAVDVGSGAGLPGIPLAVADPSRRWTLLEPRRGRAAFLEEVVRTLELDADVVACTAAEAHRRKDRFVVATARALAPVEQAFALAAPLLTAEGTAVVWVGRSARLPVNSALWGEGLATMPPRAVS